METVTRDGIRDAEKDVTLAEREVVTTAEEALTNGYSAGRAWSKVSHAMKRLREARDWVATCRCNELDAALTDLRNRAP